MKKSISILYFLTATCIIHAQNVGIGTTTPLARLHVADSSVVFVSTLPASPNHPPVSGVGNRMMWYGDKAAFRAGRVSSFQWDKDSIGFYSFASGLNSKAKGLISTAMGYQTTAVGTSSTSIGNETINGFSSTAMGYRTTAAGDASTAIGYQTIANGYASSAMGNSTTANGNYSTAMGDLTTAGGYTSTAMGNNTVAKGYSSTVLGLFNDSILMANQTSISSVTPLFIVGNGNDHTTRSNAMTVLKNGNAGIGTTTPLARLHVTDSNVLFSAAGDIPFTPGSPPVQGQGRRMMWYADKAAFRTGYVDGSHWNRNNIGIYSFASGYNTTATGEASFSFGDSTTASGEESTAFGNRTIASNSLSTAWGYLTQATGYNTTAFGVGSIASGINAVAFGRIATASGQTSTAFGEFTEASGLNATSFGTATIASGNLSTAMGNWISTNSMRGSFAIGDDNDVGPFGNDVQNQMLMRFAGGYKFHLDDAKLAMTINPNGRVGIGITTPLAHLHVKDSSVLFSATGDVSVTPGLPPIQGSGRRMMWYPDKGAFRVGTVGGAEWDQINIGIYSFASGANTTASGAFSTAIGNMTIASGNFATAMGNVTVASGGVSTSMGRGTNASGVMSTAMGNYAVASGPVAVALGNFTTASGENSIALGSSSSAAGYTSAAVGLFALAKADYSTAIGESAQANAWASIALGRHNDTIAAVSNSWIPTEPLLTVGNGTGPGDKKNALVILKNGRTGIGINNPSNPLSFPATLEKKISLYPGATGDVGFAVQGNQLQIYADHPGAMVRLGYDQAGVFTNNLDVYGNGNAWLRGVLTQASDSRLKKEVTPLQNSLEKIIQLNGYNYYWKNETLDNSLQTGVIAQEVQKLFPHLVKENKEGVLSVNYSGLIPVLIESIKEQQQQIDELKKLVEKLLQK